MTDVSQLLKPVQRMDHLVEDVPIPNRTNSILVVRAQDFLCTYHRFEEKSMLLRFIEGIIKIGLKLRFMRLETLLLSSVIRLVKERYHLRVNRRPLEKGLIEFFVEVGLGRSVS